MTKIARRFTIDPHAIMSLIKAQAGSLQKALLEAVANSMDAGAKRIDITATAKSIVVQDDGKGLKTEKEIFSFFEVFGFDHSKLDRSVGRFGVGRGQLFCFGQNTWRTGEFEMTVDIKSKGLDYDLSKGLSKAGGMRIGIDLYEPMKASELLHLEEELRRLVRYSEVPVFLNGQAISEKIADGKWMHETDAAVFKLKKDGRLSIYSQGLFVQELYAHEFGVGGTIVTKKGFPLAQNLARNDLLRKECDVWKKLEKDLRKFAKPLLDVSESKPNALMTPQARAMFARQALAETSCSKLTTLPLFTLSSKKRVKLDRLMSTGFISLANTFDPRADKLMQRNQVLGLDPCTLEDFGVETLQELHTKITKILTLGAGDRSGYHANWRLRNVLESWSKTKCFESIEQVPFSAEIGFKALKPKDLTEKEKKVLQVLRKLNDKAKWEVWPHVRASVGDSARHQDLDRTVHLMDSDSSLQACTDGVNNIWVNRKLAVKKVEKGLVGFQSLMLLFVHEQLHLESSENAHNHDAQFYQDFHDIAIDGNIAAMAMNSYAWYVQKGNATSVQRLSELEKAGVEIDVEVGLNTIELLDDSDPVMVVADVVAPAAKKATKPRAKAKM